MHDVPEQPGQAGPRRPGQKEPPGHCRIYDGQAGGREPYQKLAGLHGTLEAEVYRPRVWSANQWLPAVPDFEIRMSPRRTDYLTKSLRRRYFLESTTTVAFPWRGTVM